MRYQHLFEASSSKNSKRNATTGPHPQHEVHKQYQSGGGGARGVNYGAGGVCTSWGETPSP